MNDRRRLPPSASVYAKACAERLRRNPRDPDGLFARAAIHAASGRRAEAIVILDELAKIAPGYPGLWRFKARLYQEVGDERRAALCVATADREEPTWRH